MHKPANVTTNMTRFETRLICGKLGTRGSSAHLYACSVHSQTFQIKMADLNQWIDIAKQCKYLPENDLKVKPVDQNILLFSLCV